MTVVSKGTLASNWAVALKLPLARAEDESDFFRRVKRISSHAKFSLELCPPIQRCPHHSDRHGKWRLRACACQGTES